METLNFDQLVAVLFQLVAHYFPPNAVHVAPENNKPTRLLKLLFSYSKINF
jgi:hypothetical protein